MISGQNQMGYFHDIFSICCKYNLDQSLLDFYDNGCFLERSRWKKNSEEAS